MLLASCLGCKRVEHMSQREGVRELQVVQVACCTLAGLARHSTKVTIVHFMKKHDKHMDSQHMQYLCTLRFSMPPPWQIQDAIWLYCRQERPWLGWLAPMWIVWQGPAPGPSTTSR
jgi:hypothetical protein